uniref:Ig-like domain-containing protein n=1 Tax=Erpetoichthys calabaricus TaxID=27687 RepID=A0A8C4XBB7_ERPCA
MVDRHRRGATPGRRGILLVALLGVLVARQVTVEGIKRFGTLGRSVVLPVSLTLHSERLSIQWSFRKNDSKIRMVQHELHKQHVVSEPYRQRLSYMPNGSINLMNLRYSDEGVYEVSVTRIHGQVEMERISLHIIAPIPRTQIKVSTYVSQTGLSLFCQTEERTELSYWWLKDNKSLPRDGRHILSQENSSLEIKNMTVGDCVSYTCVTANQLDHQETRHTLTAEDSPVCPTWFYNYLLSGLAGLLCLGGLCVIICYIRKHQEGRSPAVHQR